MRTRSSTVFLMNKYGNTPLVGVELGVQRGENTMSLLRSLNLKVLHMIDLWDAYELSGTNLKTKTINMKIDYAKVVNKFQDDLNTIIIKAPSLEAVDKFEDGSLDFVYIDADHSYQAVLDDIYAWEKKVKPGGVVSGHDYKSSFDVDKAVDKYAKDNNIKITIGTNRYSDWWFVKE